MLTRAATLSLALFVPSAALFAQTSESGPAGVVIKPRIGLSQTWTDNNGLRSGAQDAALITTVTPGISMRSNAGRIKGSLDYALSGVLYLKSDEKDNTQQTLSANAVAELIENVSYLDVRASIGQQMASAFGQQTPDNRLGNPNRTEIATLSISPSLRGTLPGWFSVDLRGSVQESNAKDSIAGDSRSATASMRFTGLGGGKLGWWAQASTQSSEFKGGNDSGTSLLSVGLSLRLDADLQFGANVGSERSDYFGGVKRRSANYGVSANWTPSARTKLVADWQRHAYGNGHTLSFDHRMARSSWRIADSQSVSLGNQTGASGVQSHYDLYFFQFASVEPDPVRRDLLVRMTLQQLGISPDAPVTSGFLASGPTLQRRRDASFSLQGLRTTITAVLNHSTSRSVDPSRPRNDDLGQSNRIVQRGASFNLAHRLTPSASANLGLSTQQTRGDLSSQSSTLHSITANWNGRLGARASISLGARHSRFDSANPYRENAVFANLVQQF